MNILNDRGRVLLTLLVVFCTFLTSGFAEDKVFKVKGVVTSRDATVRIRDLISNKSDFEDDILNLELMKAPIKKDRVITLMNIAYMLQQYPELLDIHLRGARNITLKRLKNTEYLNKAKEALLKYVKSSPPWDSWEVNLMFSPNDERLINRIGTFKRVDVFPFDNKGMIGTVAFRLTFFDEYDREVGKATVAPVILQKVNVQVLRSRFPQGHIIAASDLKDVPLWIGSERKGYIIDKKQCVGSELSRAVGAGDILKGSDLLAPICAKRGESIWVKCKVGGLVVRLVAVALETGRKGDMIQVKNRSSKKIIQVKLDSSKHATYSTEG